MMKNVTKLEQALRKSRRGTKLLQEFAAGLKVTDSYDPILRWMEHCLLEASNWDKLVAGTILPTFNQSSVTDRFELFLDVLLRKEFNDRVLALIAKIKVKYRSPEWGRE
jgi:hypothetical protein